MLRFTARPNYDRQSKERNELICLIPKVSYEEEYRGLSTATSLRQVWTLYRLINERSTWVQTIYSADKTIQTVKRITDKPNENPLANFQVWDIAQSDQGQAPAIAQRGLLRDFPWKQSSKSPLSD